jgi:cell division protein FtsQ
VFPVRLSRRIADAAARVADGVLPRVLRKPARVAGRYLSGDVEVSRFAAPAMALGLLAATGAYGAWQGGHLPTLVQALTARSGFAVAQLHINGNRDTSEIDIIGAIGLDGHTSLVGFDAGEARQRVEELPWVQQATLRKIYPDSIEIDLVERRPFAVWQDAGKLTVIERDGAPIAPFAGTRHAKLPLVVGKGAPEAAADFVAVVAKQPVLAAKVSGYVRVGERRWDLQVDGRIRVRLPETGAESALAELARLDAEQALFSTDIVEVDMRLADRVTVRLSPAAAEARAEMVKERLKAMKTRRQT